MPIQLLITRLHWLAVHVYCSEVLQATYVRNQYSACDDFRCNLQNMRVAMLFQMIQCNDTISTFHKPIPTRMLHIFSISSYLLYACYTMSYQANAPWELKFQTKKHAGRSLCKLGAATCICESFCAACLANHI